MAETTTAATEAETATETAVTETAAESVADDAATETAATSVDEDEARDTLGAEINLILEGGGDDTRSVKSETKSTKSFKSLKGSIAGSLRRFSMGSKVSGLNWKSSQFSINTRKTDDYMDPVQRRTRKTIGKVVVREEHTEWIKEELVAEMRDTKLQLANLTTFSEDHPEFPGQPFSNMMEQIWIEMQLVSDYIDGINARIERLGYSPSPPTPPSPIRFPTPNFVQSFFCWHRYVSSDDEGEGQKEEKEEPEKVESERMESLHSQSENEQDESMPKSPGCCK